MPIRSGRISKSRPHSPAVCLEASIGQCNDHSSIPPIVSTEIMPEASIYVAIFNYIPMMNMETDMTLFHLLSESKLCNPYMESLKRMTTAGLH
ncbi:hypothetical protein CEXT_691181 [Caerostris extrusa]|uniref:Uncharacterized protein n=1 Tax=Caerostris extrusa TaxID=172846 RepID=A0AAV4S438_CAEEX|nr:hypothetical protein CEXT_691181 [Caerostris extrusa]